MLLAPKLCLRSQERLRFWHGLQVLGWYVACCEPRGPRNTVVVLCVSGVDASWPGLASSCSPRQGVGELRVQTSIEVEVGHLASRRLVSTS